VPSPEGFSLLLHGRGNKEDARCKLDYAVQGAILRIRILLAAAALFSAGFVAHADTVYSSYVSAEDAGFSQLEPGVAEAVAFTSNGNYIFTGASVVDLAIYSSVNGQVGTSLLDLGSHTLVVSPLTGGTNTFSATGALDLLQGQQYWLVATQISGGDFIWIETPGIEPTEYSSDAGTDFSQVSPTNLEFAIMGTPFTPAAATPEPSSFALLGSGLLGFTGLLQRRRP